MPTRLMKTRTGGLSDNVLHADDTRGRNLDNKGALWEQQPVPPTPVRNGRGDETGAGKDGGLEEPGGGPEGALMAQPGKLILEKRVDLTTGRDVSSSLGSFRALQSLFLDSAGFAPPPPAPAPHSLLWH